MKLEEREACPGNTARGDQSVEPRMSSNINQHQIEPFFLFPPQLNAIKAPTSPQSF